jgi:D-alanyl-D-alanine dipeptidase
VIEALHVRPADVGAPEAAEAPALFALADLDGAHRAIVDCGEPLVEVDDDAPCLNLYRVDGWAGVPERTWLRAGVLDRLVYAQSLLPDGFSLAVFDGWRSPETVRALYDHFYGPGSTLEPGFLANPDDPDVIPPHLTGAAVDLTLAWQGTPLALGTHFDDFTPVAWVHSLEEGGPAAGDLRSEPVVEPDRSLRRLLHAVMRAGGFVGMREEWWHFSYGDQRWAEAERRPAAIYGPTRPGATS